MMDSKKELINCTCLLQLSRFKVVGSFLGNIDVFEKPSLDNSGQPNISFVFAHTIQLIKQCNIKLDRQCNPGDYMECLLPFLKCVIAISLNGQSQDSNSSSTACSKAFLARLGQRERDDMKRNKDINLRRTVITLFAHVQPTCFKT